MKTCKLLLVLFASVVVFYSCSSPVYVQKDDAVNLGSYKTYTWVDTRSNENDNSARVTAYADITVRNGVNAALQNSGWREVNENPDALVSYDLLVERATERQSDAVYSQPFTRAYYNPRTRRWNTIYYPAQFMGYESYEVPVKQGTITITMVDANTDKAFWQGWTTENMNYARLTNDEIKRAVKNIFKKFPS